MQIIKLYCDEANIMPKKLTIDFLKYLGFYTEEINEKSDNIHTSQIPSIVDIYILDETSRYTVNSTKKAILISPLNEHVNNPLIDKIISYNPNNQIEYLKNLISYIKEIAEELVDMEKIVTYYRYKKFSSEVNLDYMAYFYQYLHNKNLNEWQNYAEIIATEYIKNNMLAVNEYYKCDLNSLYKYKENFISTLKKYEESSVINHALLYTKLNYGILGNDIHRLKKSAPYSEQLDLLWTKYQESNRCLQDSADEYFNEFKQFHVSEPILNRAVIFTFELEEFKAGANSYEVLTNYYSNKSKSFYYYGANYLKSLTDPYHNYYSHENIPKAMECFEKGLASLAFKVNQKLCAIDDIELLIKIIRGMQFPRRQNLYFNVPNHDYVLDIIKSNNISENYLSLVYGDIKREEKETIKEYEKELIRRF